MRSINLDALACPGCGTSGRGNLTASSQIEYTGRVDGEEWVRCPGCGAWCDFDEDGDVIDSNGLEMSWRANLMGALS